MNKAALLCALLIFSASSVACGDHDLTNPSESVNVVAPSFTVSKVEGQLILTVIGTFKNTTQNKIENLVVEAKFLDTKAKVIDVITQPVYGIVLPPGQEVAFRIQGTAGADPKTYQQLEARVSSGEGHPPNQGATNKANESVWKNLFVSWAPMLLLIFVWMWLARKYSGKNSAHQRSVNLIAEQNALLAEQLKAIQRIAAALPSAKPPNEV